MTDHGHDYLWPNIDAILDETSDFMESVGQTMVLNDRGAFEADLERARMAAGYDPGAGVAHLAALMYDGITTRHALTGNKRAGAIAALTFIGINGLFLDVSENELEARLRARVAGEISIEDLAAYFQAHIYPDIE